MSEEQNSGNAVGSLVMVEQASARQKTYRPTETAEDPTAHKRTTAPAVPPICSDRDASIKDVRSNAKRRDKSPEPIAMTPLEIDKKRGVIIPSSHPIPTEVPSVKSTEEHVEEEKEGEKRDNDDSVAEETAKSRVADADKHSEWSDDEEAGGLSRSESRSSRISRAMRQFFCCGVGYEAPSEENLSTRRRHYSEAI